VKETSSETGSVMADLRHVLYGPRTSSVMFLLCQSDGDKYFPEISKHHFFNHRY
jgi:hypothetical protein